jgi:pyrimidine operon attenuation protein/uracil phosphoribosyltransferase
MTSPVLPDAEQTLHALAARMRGSVARDAAFVGIYSGGAWLAERLARDLPGDHPLGFIDVSFYRDDYATTGLKGGTKRSELPFDVDGASIVLIDDVLYTGRSVRAAINELFDFGRPARIELAVLVDRGGRQLPFQAEYVGARVEVPTEQNVVLSRDAQGRLALGLEPFRRA